MNDRKFKRNIALFSSVCGFIPLVLIFHFFFHEMRNVLIFLVISGTVFAYLLGYCYASKVLHWNYTKSGNYTKAFITGMIFAFLLAAIMMILTSMSLSFIFQLHLLNVHDFLTNLKAFVDLFLLGLMIILIHPLLWFLYIIGGLLGLGVWRVWGSNIN